MTGFPAVSSTSVNHPRNVSFADRMKSKKVTDPNLVPLTDAREEGG